METITISITYDVKFWISDTHCLTTCNKIINARRGIECKQFSRGKHKAVYIDGVATFISDLKPFQKSDCPF